MVILATYQPIGSLKMLNTVRFIIWRGFLGRTMRVSQSNVGSDWVTWCQLRRGWPSWPSEKMPWMNAGDLSNWSWSRFKWLFVWHHFVCKDSHISAVLSRNLTKILKKSEWMWVWEILVFASARNLQHPRWPPSQPGRQHSTPPRKSQKSDIYFSMPTIHHMNTICVLQVILNIA